LRLSHGEFVPPVPGQLREVWPAPADACLEEPKGKRWGGEVLPAQWYVLVECRAQELTCRAVLA
jgi:hypothetical protein